MNNVFLDSKRVYDYVVSSVKLNEIETTEHCCILILVSSGNLQILALYLISEIGKTVSIHLNSLPARHCDKKCHHHRRGCSKSRSWRCITLQINLTALLDLHRFECRSDEIKSAVIHIVLFCIVFDRHIKIKRVHDNLIVCSRHNRTIRILVDRTADNRSSLLHTERCYIRTASAKAHAQRCSPSNYHRITPFSTSSIN